MRGFASCYALAPMGRRGAEKREPDRGWPPFIGIFVLAFLLRLAVSASLGPLSIDLIAVAFVIGPLTISLNALSIVAILLVALVMRSWF